MRRAMMTLLAVILAICGIAMQCAADGKAKTFTNKERIYEIPLWVNEEVTIIELGVEAVVELALKQQNTGKWTYAYGSEVPSDPKKGELTPGSSGTDNFMRIMNNRMGRIVIIWAPASSLTLDTVFTRLSDILDKQGKAFGRSFKVLQVRITDKIDGLPAYGHQIKMDNLTMTHWLVRDPATKRDVLLSYTYQDGWPDVGIFTRVRQQIKLMRPKPAD